MEMQVEIRIKKCGISNQPDVCIFDDPCLSKFGALRGSCPHPGRQFVGLLCVSLMAPLSKTQPREADVWVGICLIFNSRCRRVSVRAVLYCLRRGALRDTRKSAHCLRCAGHAPVGLSKRGSDTESDADIQLEEILTFFSNKYSIFISTWNPEVCFW